MECLGGGVNRMVCGMGVVMDGLGLWLVGLGRVKLGLGDRGDGNWGGVKL